MSSAELFPMSAKNIADLSSPFRETLIERVGATEKLQHLEADRWMSDRMWQVAHKPVAVAAGLGTMGIHRNVIHPRFGNFILLGTVLLAAEISEYSQELDYNPCLECNAYTISSKAR